MARAGAPSAVVADGPIPAPAVPGGGEAEGCARRLVAEGEEQRQTPRADAALLEEVEQGGGSSGGSQHGGLPNCHGWTRLSSSVASPVGNMP